MIIFARIVDNATTKNNICLLVPLLLSGIHKCHSKSPSNVCYIEILLMKFVYKHGTLRW